MKIKKISKILVILIISVLAVGCGTIAGITHVDKVVNDNILPSTINYTQKTINSIENKTLEENEQITQEINKNFENKEIINKTINTTINNTIDNNITDTDDVDINYNENSTLNDTFNDTNITTDEPADNTTVKIISFKQ